MLDSLLDGLTKLPLLARFAFALTVLLTVPPLCKRLRLPAVVGLLAAGVLFGPHGLQVGPKHNEVAEYFAVGGLIVAKLLAAVGAGTPFGYSRDERLVMWSLSLPQVAATLAAALVAYNAKNSQGERLIDEPVLNSVIVLMVVTSVLGPVLTEYFGRRLAPPAGQISTVAPAPLTAAG